jgi:hypothetical protein
MRHQAESAVRRDPENPASCTPSHPGSPGLQRNGEGQSYRAEISAAAGLRSRIMSLMSRSPLLHPRPSASTMPYPETMIVKILAAFYLGSTPATIKKKVWRCGEARCRAIPMNYGCRASAFPTR